MNGTCCQTGCEVRRSCCRAHCGVSSCVAAGRCSIPPAGVVVPQVKHAADGQPLTSAPQGSRRHRAVLRSNEGEGAWARRRKDQRRAYPTPILRSR